MRKTQRAGREVEVEVHTDITNINFSRRKLEALQQGRKKKGSQILRWIDCMRNYMKMFGVKENNVSNRENWRMRVQNLYASATPQQDWTR